MQVWAVAFFSFNSVEGATSLALYVFANIFLGLLLYTRIRGATALIKAYFEVLEGNGKCYSSESIKD